MKPSLRSSCALGGAFVLSLLAACGDPGDRGKALFGPSTQPATHTDAGRGGHDVGGSGSGSAPIGGSSAGTPAAGSAALGGASMNGAAEGGADSSSGGAQEGTAGAPGEPIVDALPAGFEVADIGGYRRGAALQGDDVPASAGGSAGAGRCGNILSGIVRDFKRADAPGGHPDFNADFSGSDVSPGLVASALGADRKPVYASQCEVGTAASETCPFGPQTSSLYNFNQWYRTANQVNSAFLLELYLAPVDGGLYGFQSLNYFPLDGVDFDQPTQGDDGKLHNFGFTTELHARFIYKGGEMFRFEGDDDVWVFMDGKLAVDLGGLHPMQQRKVELDKESERLGLVKGGTYALDLFHAERHTGQSTFRIETNLAFVDCGGAK